MTLRRVEWPSSAGIVNLPAMLVQRIGFGLLLIAVLVGLIYADDRIARSFADAPPAAWTRLGLHTADGLVVTMILAALGALGTRECHRLLTAAGHEPLLLWPLAVNMVLIAVPFVNANQTPGGAFSIHDAPATVTLLTIAFFVAGTLIIRRRQIDGAAGNLAATMLVVVYLGLLPQFLVRLRVEASGGAAWLLLYYLAVVKSCDIGAYFTGYAIGRHKLIPWLSPKKTIEGLAGGIGASVVVAVGVAWLLPAFAKPPDQLPALMHAALFGAAMAAFGQGGDLLESLFKRGASAKDSANAIPAFGGVLDILDSPLVTAPIACWMLL